MKIVKIIIAVLFSLALGYVCYLGFPMTASAVIILLLLLACAQERASRKVAEEQFDKLLLQYQDILQTLGAKIAQTQILTAIIDHNEQENTTVDASAENIKGADSEE